MSLLEAKFKRYWEMYAPGFPLEAQFTDSRITGKKRKLPFDFRIQGTNILVEIQGATYKANTAHTSGRGITRDCFKSLKAQMHGYQCWQLTTSMITHENIKELAAYVSTEFQSPVTS